MRSALNSSAVWESTAKGERLFHCGIVRGKKEFFRASLYVWVWYLQYWALCDDLVDLQTASRGQVLVFFYRHSTRMYLMKKQGGPIPTGLKRWPLKLIKHLADTTCVRPSPAGPTGCCPLNFSIVKIYIMSI